jgi:hypothetical protein
VSCEGKNSAYGAAKETYEDAADAELAAEISYVATGVGMMLAGVGTAAVCTVGEAGTAGLATPVCVGAAVGTVAAAAATASASMSEDLAEKAADKAAAAKDRACQALSDCLAGGPGNDDDGDRADDGDEDDDGPADDGGVDDHGDEDDADDDGEDSRPLITLPDITIHVDLDDDAPEGDADRPTAAGDDDTPAGDVDDDMPASGLDEPDPEMDAALMEGFARAVVTAGR